MTTTIEPRSWETHLLAMAYEAMESDTPGSGFQVDAAALSNAYQYCANVTKNNSRTFYMASALLPPDKRQAARALYAFSRITDDIVDRNINLPASQVLVELNHWRMVALHAQPARDDRVPLAWADARKRYIIPLAYAEQLIHGIGLDLIQTRYDTFADLTTYCYGVACTVGLMAMHITGFVGEEALPYAIRLGVALQLTNILRDVGEDWEAGRLYLPLEELHAFGLKESDIANRVNDSRWKSFMQFQIKRNRALYQQALPGIALLDPDGRFAIQASGELYQGILDDIEAHDYDVFHHRAHLSTLEKLSRLPAIWWRARNHLKQRVPNRHDENIPIHSGY